MNGWHRVTDVRTYHNKHGYLIYVDCGSDYDGLYANGHLIKVRLRK